MICSSSCDSANIAVASSLPLTPVHLEGCGRPRISHGDNESDPRARTSGNGEGPKCGIRRPARYTASPDHDSRICSASAYPDASPGDVGVKPFGVHTERDGGPFTVRVLGAGQGVGILPNAVASTGFQAVGRG